MDLFLVLMDGELFAFGIADADDTVPKPLFLHARTLCKSPSSMSSDLPETNGTVGNAVSAVKAPENPENNKCFMRNSASISCDVSRPFELEKVDASARSAQENSTVITVQSNPSGSQILGKRKFQPDDDHNDACYEEEEEDEAGLSLLFAASLLQHQQPDTTSSAQQQQQQDAEGSIEAAAAIAAAAVLPDPLVTATTKAAAAATKPPPPVATAARVFNDDADSSHINNDGAATTAAATATSTTTMMIQQPLPTDNDVLLGRGGGVNKHIGNIIYRRVVEYNKTVYKQVPKRQRMLVSQSIVQTILNSGGRFLQQQANTAVSEAVAWKEIGFRRAVQKTSQALRE